MPIVIFGCDSAFSSLSIKISILALSACRLPRIDDNALRTIAASSAVRWVYLLSIKVTLLGLAQTKNGMFEGATYQHNSFCRYQSRARMMRIGFPRRPVVITRLITPGGPSITIPPRE